MPAARMSREHRLLRPAQFQRVFAEPVKSADRCLVVLSRTTETGQPARLGLAIAKRHIKKAVARNRIKRLIRESFRHHKAQLAGRDFVVLARGGLDRRDNREIFNSLDQHWQRLTQT